MTGARILVCAVMILAISPPAYAAPRQSSTGEACNSTGTARKDGKDAATGEKLNCLWDTCTYCGTTGGQIDCSILKTEYSNGRDCKAAASIRGNQSIIRKPPLLRAPVK